MRRCVVVLIVVAVLAFAGPSSLIRAQPSSTPSAPIERFHALIVAPAGPAPIAGDRCPALMVDFRGGGLATHLGRYTTVQTHCIDPTGADPTVFSDGLYTFTAEDESTIAGRYNGRLVPTETTATDGLMLLDGRFTIETGTGRFAGVTGGGSADGLLNPQTGEANVVLDGFWIPANTDAAVAGTPAP